MAVKVGVANRLRELRQRYGLTQERLAADLGVTRHTILALEVGRYVPSIELALRLAAYFDQPLESIFWLFPAAGDDLRGAARRYGEPAAIEPAGAEHHEELERKHG